MVFDPLRAQRAKRVEADVQRDSFHVELREQLGGEVEPGRGRRGRAGVPRVDRLVALGLLEPFGDVRRQRRLAARLALEPQAPASLAEVLEQLDRAVALPRL